MATTKITTPKLFDFSSLNTALQLPTGDTASRPSSPSTGEWRYNNETKYVEYWDSTEWREIDTESLPIADDFPQQNFNVSTYAGSGAAQTINAKFDQAANLNGSNSSIDFTPNNPVIFPNTTGGTLSFWIRPNSVSTNQDIFATSPNGGWSSPYGQLIRLANNGKMQLYQYSTTGGNALSSPLETSTLSVNVWTHVALSYEGNSIGDAIQFYINGSPDGNTTLSADSPLGNSSNNLQVRIGYRNDSGIQNPYDGAIDQVRIYHSKLSDADVLNLYNNETATTASSLNFPSGKTAIATYQFNGNAADVSGTYGGTTTNIGYTGLLFQPDFVWVKRSSSSEDNVLFDSVRGVQEQIRSNSSGQQSTKTNALSSFDSDGFTTGDNNALNTNNQTYVAWCWKAGGAPTTDNVAGVGNVPTSGSVKVDSADSTAALTGTIAAKKISANTKAGFSIVRYDGTGTAGTIDHLLGDVPNLILVKRTDSSGNWIVGSTEIDSNSWGKILQLDLTDAEQTYDGFNNTPPTTSVFSLGTKPPVNNGSGEYIAYCFANINSYQKIGSYTGNGSANGPIINTGFEPAFVLVKNVDDNGSNWIIVDNKRNTANPRNLGLFPQGDFPESSFTNGINFFTNGFQVVDTDNDFNGNGDTLFYLAIAANVESAPTLANSFSTDEWTGTSAIQNVYSSIAPNFSWTKNKGSNTAYYLFDSVRTSGYEIYSNLTNSQYYDPNTLTSFNPNGFSLGTGTGVNNSGQNYIAWNWKATELPAINTDGTITSQVSANQAAGFSILKYTGDGSTSKTVGHGLSSAPEFVIVKRIDSSADWYVWITAVMSITGSTSDYIVLNSDAQKVTAASVTNIWGGNVPSATTIGVGDSGGSNANGGEYISYCWHSVAGYSKIGSYSGSGVSGKEVTLDFSPSFVLIKRTNASAGWVIVDDKRGTAELYPNLPNQEDTTATNIVLGTNKFTLNTTGSWYNASGGTYFYMAIKIN